jgi:hypothetical protein
LKARASKSKMTKMLTRFFGMFGQVKTREGLGTRRVPHFRKGRGTKCFNVTMKQTPYADLSAAVAGTTKDIQQ